MSIDLNKLDELVTNLIQTSSNAISPNTVRSSNLSQANIKKDLESAIKEYFPIKVGKKSDIVSKRVSIYEGDVVYCDDAKEFYFYGLSLSDDDVESSSLEKPYFQHIAVNSKFYKKFNCAKWLETVYEDGDYIRVTFNDAMDERINCESDKKMNFIEVDETPIDKDLDNKLGFIEIE